MTTLRFLLILSILVHGSVRSEQPTSEWTLRDLSRIRTEGNTTFTTAEIRRALAFDAVAQKHVDVQVPMQAYADIMAERVAAGYQHRGFPEASANGRFDEATGEVVLHVTEGPRVMCGEISVTGVDDGVAEAVRSRLNGTQKPESESGIRWQTHNTATWKIQTPASFADSNTQRSQNL